MLHSWLIPSDFVQSSTATSNWEMRNDLSVTTNCLAKLYSVEHKAAMGNSREDLRVFYFYWWHKFAIKLLLVKTHYFCIVYSTNTQRKHFCVSSATMVRLYYATGTVHLLSSFRTAQKCTMMIYLLTAIGLSPGGSSTVHIYTQTIHRTTRNKQYIEQHDNFGRVRAVPRLG